jgi:uncharacterized RmlC-like cupin family protein
MALEEFDRQPLSEREKGIVRIKSISNYTMGAVLICAGMFFFFPTAKTEAFLNKYDSTLMKMMGIICWIYGAFRMYRGYKKNYFRES